MKLSSKLSGSYNIWQKIHNKRIVDIETIKHMEITDKRIINLYYNLAYEYFPKKYEDVFKYDDDSITYLIDKNLKINIEISDEKYKINVTIYENEKYVDTYFFYISPFEIIRIFKLKSKIKKIRNIINNHEADVYYKKMVNYLPKNFKRAEKLKDLL